MSAAAGRSQVERPADLLPGQGPRGSGPLQGSCDITRRCLLRQDRRPGQGERLHGH